METDLVEGSKCILWGINIKRMGIIHLDTHSFYISIIIHANRKHAGDPPDKYILFPV